MLILKLTVACVFIAVGCALYEARLSARGRFADPSSIERHKRMARRALAGTVLGIILIEIAVHVKESVWDPVHLSFAAPFFALIVTLQWLSGFRRPALHKVLGYACLAAYVGTAATGFALLYNL